MSHQVRSTDWLRQMLKEGFHIHHLDGDHGNDAPNNLVLIEGADHFRLHGGDLPYIGRVKVKFRPKPLTAKQVSNREDKKEVKRLIRQADREMERLEKAEAYRAKLDVIMEERLAKMRAKKAQKHAYQDEQDWTY